MSTSKKSLTTVVVRAAKPGAKAYKITDEKGMYLWVTPAGGKSWRLKYRYKRKEKLITLGKYPELSLKAAREARDNTRILISQGIDPMAERKKQKDTTGDSFKSVAEEWRLGRSHNTPFLLSLCDDVAVTSAGEMDAPQESKVHTSRLYREVTCG